MKTIETYREHLKQKLGVDSGPELIRSAVHWVETGQGQPTGSPADRKGRFQGAPSQELTRIGDYLITSIRVCPLSEIRPIA